MEIRVVTAAGVSGREKQQVEATAARGCKEKEQKGKRATARRFRDEGRRRRRTRGNSRFVEKKQQVGAREGEEAPAGREQRSGGWRAHAGHQTGCLVGRARCVGGWRWWMDGAE